MEAAKRPSLKSFALTLCVFLGFARAADHVRRAYEQNEITVDESKHDEQFFTYITRPDIVAPKWNLEVHDESAISPGYWFMAAYGIVEQQQNDDAYVGPYIYDSKGELVWSGGSALKNFATFDFKVSQLRGEDVLSMIYPPENAVYLLNNSYEIQEAIYTAEKSREVNIHDFQSLGNSYIVLNRDKINATKQDMALVGFDGSCILEIPGFEEVDYDTGKTIFEWSPIDHIPLNESYRESTVTTETCRRSGWDYSHPNSVDKLPDGDYLMSARHTASVYKISRESGSVLWRLNGKLSDFEWTGEDFFAGQHDARCLSQNDTHMVVSMMDNGFGSGPFRTPNKYSRGLIVTLRTDSSPMTAEVVSRFIHPQSGQSELGGNLQLLPNGNVFMGWATRAVHSEHTPDGKVIMEAYLPSGLKTYRTYKFSWTGHPRQPPDVQSWAVETQDSTSIFVYVSWNGATEVASWNLYRSNRQGDLLKLLASNKRDGFETMLEYGDYVQHIIVEAVDRDGNRLALSRVARSEKSLDPEAIKQQLRRVHPSIIQNIRHHAPSSAQTTLGSGIVYLTTIAILGFAALFAYQRRRVLSWFGLKGRSAQYSRLSTTGKSEMEET